MKKKGRHRLRNFIFAVLLLSAIVPIAVFGTWMINMNSQRIKNVMHDDLTMLSVNQIRNIESFCEGRKENLNTFAQLSIVKEALWASLNSRHMDVRYLDNMLAEQKMSKDYVNSISVVDKNFKVVSSTENTTRGELSQLKDSGVKMRGGDFYMSNLSSRETESGIQNSVIAITGVFSGDKLIGYIVEEVEASYFDCIGDEEFVGVHGNICLIDGNDNAISYGKALTDEEASSNAFIMENEEVQSIWDSIDRQVQPVGEFEYNYEGSKWIAYYSDIKYTDWTIRVSMDAGYYMSEADNYRLLVVFVLIAIVIAMMIIEICISRFIIAPVDKIVNTLSKIQNDQDYSARVDYHSDTELGYVAEQLDEMLSIIQADTLRGQEIRHNLEELADTDPLTGVDNKRAFGASLDIAIEDTKMCKSRIAVGFVDIDDFRNFNTLYGHRVGDQVIRFVASTLDRTINGNVGRNGGDEFTFYITDGNSIDNINDTLDEYLDMMLAGIGLREQGTRAVVTCSIGVVIASGDSELNRNMLIEKADEAMYQAKEAGKNTYRIIRL